ncbi:hypothetical protein T8K17_13840 [Thalassobaculum sp. OXR-137]|uniref:hypothetical protein n=1 Tax=Thalassobaculum sp. OXR-137 TaxID=3100173 RepID=UPI002AC95736|nr:hypothetical protein [Thalassobaculum sp. OXR-137]WPZ32321.1 hypothetical protein T8K17_13840 [Thalassobaculum sp. OXR-137]
MSSDTATPPAFTPALFAIYDLSVSPVTFDVMNFFVLANLWAMRAGAAGYHVIFTAGPGGQFRDLTPKDKSLDTDEKIWRLRHIMATHAHIAKRCLGVSLYDRRDDFGQMLRAIHPSQLFPPGYTQSDPKIPFMLADLFAQNPTAEELDTFAPHPSATRKVDAWLERYAPRGRPVSLTLRSSTIETRRNSNTPDWLEAAARIRARGFDPIVLPDTDLVTAGLDLGAFGDIPSYPLGAIDLELRAALYSRCLINLADNGGPAFINYFMADSSAVCFLPVEKLPEAVTFHGRGLDRMAELLGVAPYESFPGATPARRFIWKPDTLDNIMDAFDAAVEFLG